jgi:drug/metabolite transporter (DMT)-like permease
MKMALLAGGFSMFRGLEKYIIVWIISVLISSIAQVMLKAEANKEHESRLKEYLNPMGVTAYAIFFLSTFLTMYALKYVPLTYSPIIEPLSYIFVPVIGVLVLKEKLSARRVLGIVIMLAGIVIFSL